MNQTSITVPPDDGGPGCFIWMAVIIIVIIILTIIF